MTLDAFLALLLYALVTSITPGPEQLHASGRRGVNFGIVRDNPAYCSASASAFLRACCWPSASASGAVLTAFSGAAHRTQDRGGRCPICSTSPGRSPCPRSPQRQGPRAEAKPMRFIDAGGRFNGSIPKAWVMAINRHGCLHQPPIIPSCRLVLIAVAFSLVNSAERLDMGRFRHGRCAASCRIRCGWKMVQTSLWACCWRRPFGPMLK